MTLSKWRPFLYIWDWSGETRCHCLISPEPTSIILVPSPTPNHPFFLLTPSMFDLSSTYLHALSQSNPNQNPRNSFLNGLPWPKISIQLHSPSKPTIFFITHTSNKPMLPRLLNPLLTTTVVQDNSCHKPAI